MNLNLENKIKNIPNKCGVYIYKNEFEEIIYIGKAKNLKSRVSQYFLKNQDSIKTKSLVKRIKDLDFIITDNEIDALILENDLIKKHNPKYNIKLKSDITYSYLKLTDEKFPKLVMTRKILYKKTKKFNGEIYFGPYPSANTRTYLYNLCVEFFQILTNKTYSNKSQLNFDIGLAPAKNKLEINKIEYDKSVENTINFLKGKNSKKIYEELKNQMKNFSEKLEFEKAQKIKDKITSIKDIENKILLSSINENFKDIIVFKKIKNDKYKFLILKISKEIILKKEEFELENQTFSNNILEEFLKIYYRENQIPDSIIIEDIINEKFETFLSKKRGKNIKIIIPKKADNLKLLNLAILNLESSMNFNLENSLKEKLNLKQIPNTIECFDMSNFSYEDLVGAMVRFKNQKKDTKNYRKYEIKSFSNKNDDYKSFREVMFRRYFKNSDLSNTELSKVIFDNRLKVNISTDKIIELPNLIICDGGVGQLNSTIKILKELKIYEKVDVVSLAKKEEIIYKYENEELVEFDLNNNSSEMLYIRKIRDSVHNFVITFNRSKRKSLK